MNDERAAAREAREIPLRLPIADRERVATLVRRPHELVADEARRHMLGRVVVRRQMRDLKAVDVAQIEVVVATAQALPVSDDAPSVRGDRGDRRVAANLEDALLPALEVARDDVEVDAVPAIRRVRDRAPGRVRRVVLEALVDDERLVPDIQLRPLVPAQSALDENPAVGQELPRDGLLEEGDLPHPGYHEELGRSRNVRGDEQLAAIGRERERRRHPQLEQLAEVRHQSRIRCIVHDVPT